MKRSKNTDNLSERQFKMRANKKYNYRYDYTHMMYISLKSKIKIKCHTHGFFYEFPYKHLKGSACPHCKESNGEKRVREYLEKNSIKFEEQKVYKRCKNKYLIPYDFYLPKYRTLIEFNGKQHYEAVKFFGGKKSFERQKKVDLIKEQYAKDNNINLLIIPYTDYNRIEEIIDIYIKNLENDKKGKFND